MLNNKFFAGILLGAAAGAALALFIVSDKGKEVIEDLKGAADDAGGKLKSHFEDIQDGVSELVKKGKEFVGDLQGKVEDITD